MIDYMKEERDLSGDLLNNSSDRVVICICIDASFSMVENNRMKHVNNGIKKFITNCINDIYAKDSIDLCLIRFGGSKPKIIQPFDNIKRVRYKDIEPGGATPMGKAVNLALDEIEKRIEQFDMFGRTHYKPWLIIMSDGKATDNIEEASFRTKKLLKSRSIKTKCIDMSEGNDKTSLEEFTLDGEVGTIGAFEIESFFSMLSRSAAGLSKSTPGEDEFTTIGSYDK